MAKKKKTERFSPRTIFSVGTLESYQQIAAKPAVHIDCTGGLCFDNSRALVAYSDTMIQLDMGTVGVRVEGDSLRLKFYRWNRVAVRGHITTLEFLYGGEKK